MTVTDQSQLSTDVSRDPGDYAPTDHFLRRFSPRHGHPVETRTNPAITATVIEECITNGVVADAGDGAHALTATVDGHDWRMIVHLAARPRELITAYVPGVHGSPGRH